MSQLIAIAERIKVITNIQKTAHAMQLISMSTLSRVSSKKRALQLYTQQLEALVQELGINNPQPVTQINPTPQKILYLIIGSQKGFCGSFNITLFNFIKGLHNDSSSCIAVGTYAYDFCMSQKMKILNKKITYSLTTLIEKADTIFNQLLSVKSSYESVVVISNYNASIFLQRPHTNKLPLTYSYTTCKETFFTIEQPFPEITTFIENLTLKNQLIQLMLESLRAENSARALSMDSSTRNAKNVLTQMKLEYNKLRQAKVTKELTELSSSLID